MKLHQRHHPCCRPFCPVALEPSDAAFFPSRARCLNGARLLDPVGYNAPALRDRKAHIDLLCWQLHSRESMKTQPKFTFIFHENRFFQVMPSMFFFPICNPEPLPAAPLGVVARPCRARQPERHGETLAASGQDLVRDVLGVHQVIPLGSHWSPIGVPSKMVILCHFKDGMDFYIFLSCSKDVLKSLFKSGNHQVYGGLKHDKSDKSMVYPNGQPWKDPIPSRRDHSPMSHS